MTLQIDLNEEKFRSSTIGIPVSDIHAIAGVVTLSKSLEELKSVKEIVESKE
jgi:hypothetical protein